MSKAPRSRNWEALIYLVTFFGDEIFTPAQLKAITRKPPGNFLGIAQAAGSVEWVSRGKYKLTKSRKQMTEEYKVWRKHMKDIQATIMDESIDELLEDEANG